MDQQTIYRTAFGVPMFETPVTTARTLPAMGVNGFKLVHTKKGLTYWHYQYEGVNVHVFGDDEVIEYLARTGKQAIFEFDVEQKTGPRGTIYHLNLRLVGPEAFVTHEVAIVGKTRGKDFMFFFGTAEMRGIGIGIRRV